MKDKIITSTHFSSPVTLKWKMFYSHFRFYDEGGFFHDKLRFLLHITTEILGNLLCE